MADSIGTDRRVLVGEAYSDQSRLAARQAIYAYLQPKIDLPAQVLDALAGVRGTVVDVGCGNGVHLRRLRQERPDLTVWGFDLSVGMRPDVVADAQQLPLADGSVNGLIAAHMLYHVPDVAVAVREFARVLSGDGLLVVVTPALDDRHEIGDLWFSVTGSRFVDPSRRFAFEHAPEVLRTGFAEVRTGELRSTIVLPESKPIVDYIHSARAGLQRLLPSEDWEKVLSLVAAEADARIAANGAFTITTHIGLLVCSNS